jgi:large subunit ribosomal protein L24
MAERQVTRRRKKLATTEFLSEVKRKSMKETQDLHEDAVLALHQARKARREDWEMGPIAPRREVPRVADGNFADPILWGTISPARAFSNVQRSPQALEQRCAWAGGREFCCLAEGDRVVITEGPMKGRLDKVSQVDLDAGMVRLEDAKVSLLVLSALPLHDDLQAYMLTRSPCC